MKTILYVLKIYMVVLKVKKDICVKFNRILALKIDSLYSILSLVFESDRY